MWEITAILSQRKSLVLAVAGTVFSAAALVPNAALVGTLWGDAAVPLSDKFIIPLKLIVSLPASIGMLSSALAAGTALLTGVNAVLIVHLLKSAPRDAGAGAGAGIAGLIAGAFGIGCAACGSLIAATILATAGGTALLTLLPLRGAEFGILGIAFAGLAAYFLARRIMRPFICT